MKMLHVKRVYWIPGYRDKIYAKIDSKYAEIWIISDRDRINDYTITSLNDGRKYILECVYKRRPCTPENRYWRVVDFGGNYVCTLNEMLEVI